jgi:hypothetical protein
MGTLISNTVYVLTTLLDLTAFVLVLECLSFNLSGSQWNGVRKGLFKLTYPLLLWSENFFSVRLGAFNFRGLLTALLLFLVSYLGLPWLAFLSYSLRG